MQSQRSGAGALAPQLLLLLMIAIWGASYAAVKACLDRGVPPFVLIAARFWLAVLCLLPLLPRDWRRALGASRRAGVATGIALLTGYALQTFGMRETSASMGGFLAGLIVLLVALGAWLVFGERLKRATIAGLALGLLGLVLLCLCGGGDGDQKDSLRGILLQIGSSTSYAAHILLISRLSPRGNEIAYSFWQLLVTALGATALLPLAAGFGAPSVYGTSALVWFCVAYLGVFATALGIAVQSRVQPRIRPGQVAVLFATQPAFAATFGFVFLGDRLGPWKWIGGAAIAAGVIVAGRARAAANFEPRPAT